MPPARELPPAGDARSRSRAAAALLADALAGPSVRRRVPRGEDLLASGAPGFALLHHGALRLERDRRVVRTYEPGDLAPTGVRPELAGFRLRGETAVEVTGFEAQALVRAIAACPGLAVQALEHLSCEQAVLLGRA